MLKQYIFTETIRKDRGRSASPPIGFTLIELLVVIAIIRDLGRPVAAGHPIGAGSRAASAVLQ